MTTRVSSAASASRIRCESASEWAGLPLSTTMARYRAGWSVRISSAMTLQGTSPDTMRAPATGLRGPPSSPATSARRTLPSGTRLDGAYCVPGRPKLPVSSHTSFSR